MGAHSPSPNPFKDANRGITWGAIRALGVTVGIFSGMLIFGTVVKDVVLTATPPALVRAAPVLAKPAPALLVTHHQLPLVDHQVAETTPVPGLTPKVLDRIREHGRHHLNEHHGAEHQWVRAWLDRRHGHGRPEGRHRADRHEGHEHGGHGHERHGGSHHGGHSGGHHEGHGGGHGHGGHGHGHH
jgi:hypothetical protein